MNSLFEVTIVDVLTLVASSFALYFSWNNRKSPLRENLYNRQIDSANVIIKGIVEVEDSCLDWSVLMKLGNWKEAESFYDKLSNQLDSLEKEYAVAELILPLSVLLEFDKVMSYYSEINKKIPTREISEINIEELSNMIYSLSNVIREFIGLEKLSQANKRIIAN